MFKSLSSAPHMVTIYIFIFLYSWVRNSSLRKAIWKFKNREVSPKWMTDQTVEQWKLIISTPGRAEKHCACRLCHVFVIEPNAFLFQLSNRTRKGIWKATILVLQFNYFLIHELDRNYGTIYNLAITWNVICVIGCIIHIYSLSDQTIPRP